MYDLQTIVVVMNRAADDVIDASDAPDEGKRDVANLIVNATAHYLENPEATLMDAIEAADYDATPDEVIEWCRS